MLWQYHLIAQSQKKITYLSTDGYTPPALEAQRQVRRLTRRIRPLIATRPRHTWSCKDSTNLSNQRMDFPFQLQMGQAERSTCVHLGF